MPRVDHLLGTDRFPFCLAQAASTTALLSKDRDPGLAANLSLDAQRQAFAAFIEGFSTYTSLLARVKVWNELEHIVICDVLPCQLVSN